MLDLWCSRIPLVRRFLISNALHSRHSEPCLSSPTAIGCVETRPAVPFDNVERGCRQPAMAPKAICQPVLEYRKQKTAEAALPPFRSLQHFAGEQVLEKTLNRSAALDEELCYLVKLLAASESSS